MRNFADRKGTAVGIVKAWTGLGGGIFTQAREQLALRCAAF